MQLRTSLDPSSVLKEVLEIVVWTDGNSLSEPHCACRRLKEFNAQGNSITGHMPFSWSMMGNLTILSLASNNLQGDSTLWQVSTQQHITKLLCELQLHETELHETSRLLLAVSVLFE